MNRVYQDILKIALSGADNHNKYIRIKNKWALINEHKLFNYAQRDEVTSHIADVLHNGNIQYNKF